MIIRPEYYPIDLTSSLLYRHLPLLICHLPLLFHHLPLLIRHLPCCFVIFHCEEYLDTWYFFCLSPLFFPINHLLSIVIHIQKFQRTNPFLLFVVEK